MYSVNFQREFKKGRQNRMFWHDNNTFKKYKDALEFAMDMTELWRKEEDELITFQIITH